MPRAVVRMEEPLAWDQASETVAPAAGGVEAHPHTAAPDANQVSVTVKAASSRLALSKLQVPHVHSRPPPLLVLRLPSSA
jgi:hypothetical protein